MNFETLKELIVDTLGCDAERVTPEASLTEDLEADSLDAVELNLAIEEASGINIPDEKMAELKTVGEILAYLESQAG